MLFYAFLEQALVLFVGKHHFGDKNKKSELYRGRCLKIRWPLI